MNTVPTINTSSTSAQTVTTPKTIEGFLFSEGFKNQLKRALPKHMTADRMARIALTEIRKVPKLAQCNPGSFLGAVIQSAQLGLEPGNNLGHAYLVPYKNECQLIVGYRGMIDLARRSGQIITLQAHAVYENDKFEFEFGLDPKLAHVPARSNRGKAIYFYAAAKLKDGGEQFDVMSVEDIHDIMRQSKASGSGPWQTHFDEMAKKTVMRRLFKWLPVSIEMSQAVTLDEKGDAGIQDNSYLLDDVDGLIESQPTPVSATEQLTHQLDKKLG